MASISAATLAARTQNEVTQLSKIAIPSVDKDRFQPGTGLAPTGVPPVAIPTSLADLNEHVTRSYDLSVSAAAQLNIPVVGSVGGGYARRVVVLERVDYKSIEVDGTQQQYGWAVRLCLTLNKWNADLKASLPFLAASAQIGSIDAQWTMQVLGLAGKKIDESQMPPTELNVETFVLAKQSLEKLIAAVHDPGTTFKALLVGTVKPADAVAREFRAACAKTYALSSIGENRSLSEALKRLQATEPELIENVSQVYEYYGLKNPSERPTDDLRKLVRALLGRIQADVSEDSFKLPAEVLRKAD